MLAIDNRRALKRVTSDAERDANVCGALSTTVVLTKPTSQSVISTGQQEWSPPPHFAPGGEMA